VYQSWKTKELPPAMAQGVEKLHQLNPDYQLVLFDDQDCRSFLLAHFGQSYVDAFDSLVPGAFKCDLWRYAMLYVNGGFYLDIDMVPLVAMDDIVPADVEFVSVKDMNGRFQPPCKIYQAFIGVVPKHPVLKLALELSFANIVTRRVDMLSNFGITGPTVMGVALNLYWGKKRTHEEIAAGRHGNLVLFSMDPEHTYDLDGRAIFENKIKGYKPAQSYSRLNHYVDDPVPSIRQSFLILFIVLATFSLMLFTACLVCAVQWHRCRRSVRSK